MKRGWIIALTISLLLMAGAVGYSVKVAVAVKSDNDALRQEIKNIKGTMKDNMETVIHLTHPQTIQDRTFDLLLGKGEFANKP
jgi:hypothetical protein